MPLYDYRCPKCGHTEEIRHGINDLGIFMCTICTDETSGPVTYLKRMISVPGGIVFRGPGFYRNDSRNQSKTGARPKPAKKKEKKETTNDL